MKTATELLTAVKNYCIKHGTELGEYQLSDDEMKPIRLLGGTKDFVLIEAKIVFSANNKPKTIFKYDGKITSIYK